ncbi:MULTISPECIES: DUF1573 domain-containing protein [Prevotella]|uniref:DUF1573 domain-containing protein n=1 Tax=Prevotella TaxID=838 RepID=UPI0020B13C2D|nr:MULTISPECIES: DUF1573 domain-containing protein [Prevotella]
MTIMNLSSHSHRLVMTLFTLCVAPMALMAQKITVAQPTIDCGQVQYRRPVTVQFEARNQSGRPITIAKVRSSCGCTVASYPSQAIANGKTFKVSAVYDARQLGHFQKELALYVDGGNKPVYLTLRGVVVEEVIDYTGDFPLELGDLRVDKTDVEYDDVNRGERPFFRINILNPTSKAVSPQVMHLPNYLEAQVSPSTIAAGRPGVVTLTLLSDKLRDFGLTQTTIYLGSNPGERVSADKAIEVSAVLLPSFKNITDATRQYAPKMSLSATYLDLGSFDGKKKKRGEIIITNNGRTDLEIRNIQMFTAGLEVSLSTRKIAPGASARLRVTAVASALHKVRTRPRILMITNDPDNAKVVIAVDVKR